MRSLTVSEIDVVSGGELVCTAGVPSGVKCEGKLSDWMGAAKGAWDFLASTPGTVPWMATKLLEK